MPSLFAPLCVVLVASALALLAGCAREVAAPRDGNLAETPAIVSATATPAARSADAPPPRAEVRYLALGDSFTIGTGSSPSEAFPARLSERLRTGGRAVVLKNVAVNGFTTQDLLDIELPEVSAFAPTFVTLAVGANDLVRGGTPERYRAQVRRIFAALAAAGVPGTSVVALPQPDWSLSPAAASFGDPSALGARIEAFNAVLREEAGAAGARYIDVFPLMREQAQRGVIARDGLHPAAAAHDAWAAEIAARLSL